MHPSPGPRSARIGVAILVIVLILAAGGLAAWMAAGRQATPAQPAPEPPIAQPAAAQPAPVRQGRVTAVRQADGLPTWVLVDLGPAAGVKIGDRLLLQRSGVAVAAMLVETQPADGSGSMCRLLDDSWTTGASRVIATGEPISTR